MVRRPPPAISRPIAAELPSPTAREGRDEALLEASRRVVALLLRERHSAFSVRALAEHAGLSERTFYRYFPRKEDAIRPYVDAWIEEIVERIRTAPRSAPLQSVVIAAHAKGFDAARDHRWEALLPVLSASESLRAVWLQSVTNAETAFAQVVAQRLGIPSDSQQAKLCGAVLVTAGRLALASRDRLPGDVFAECLALLGPTLFRAPIAKSDRPRVSKRATTKLTSGTNSGAKSQAGKPSAAKASAAKSATSRRQATTMGRPVRVR